MFFSLGCIEQNDSHILVSEQAVKSPNLDYSHFISFPLTLHPELADKLVNFQKSILGDTSEDEGKDRELDRTPDVAVKLKVEDDKHVKVDIANIHRVSYPPKVSNPSELRALKPSAFSCMTKAIFHMWDVL